MGSGGDALPFPAESRIGSIKMENTLPVVTQDDREHVTEDGLLLKLRPIAIHETELIREGIEDEYRARQEPIDPPKYKVKTAGGGEVEHDLTKDNLDVDDNEEETERRHREWGEHISAKARMYDEIWEETKDCILDGVIWEEDVPKDWIEKKKKRHIRLPEDKDALVLLYKKIELIKSENDKDAIRDKIVKISRPNLPSNSAVAAAQRGFQDTVPEK